MAGGVEGGILEAYRARNSQSLLAPEQLTVLASMLTSGILELAHLEGLIGHRWGLSESDQVY